MLSSQGQKQSPHPAVRDGNLGTNGIYFQGFTVSAHYEEIFIVGHLDPCGSVLSSDAGKYLKCSKIY